VELVKKNNMKLSWMVFISGNNHDLNFQSGLIGLATTENIMIHERTMIGKDV